MRERPHSNQNIYRRFLQVAHSCLPTINSLWPLQLLSFLKTLFQTQSHCYNKRSLSSKYKDTPPSVLIASSTSSLPSALFETFTHKSFSEKLINFYNTNESESEGFETFLKTFNYQRFGYLGDSILTF